MWNPLPPFIGNARQLTLIFGKYMQLFSLLLDTATGKESGKINHIERFNCTTRQRISRLMRKTLSFSKKLGNHMGAIWYFVHHYNVTL